MSTYKVLIGRMLYCKWILNISVFITLIWGVFEPIKTDGRLISISGAA